MKTEEETAEVQEQKALEQVQEEKQEVQPEEINLRRLSEAIPVKWRVQSTKYGKANCVAYVDARDVQKHLDEVCGVENWQSRHKEEKGNLFCEIGIYIKGRWIWKSDVGTESNIERQKGEASDSFKRAAVMWGVGRFVYDYPVIQVKTAKNQNNNKEYPCSNKAGKKLLYDGSALTAYINYCFEKFDLNEIKKGL